MDNKNYFIEKIGTKGRGEHVRVDVDFYSIDDLGNKESLFTNKFSEIEKRVELTKDLDHTKKYGSEKDNPSNLAANHQRKQQRQANVDWH